MTTFLFSSKQDLVNIIQKYKNNVYSDIHINEKILSHFIKYFILKEKHYLSLTIRRHLSKKQKFLNKMRDLFMQYLAMDDDVINDLETSISSSPIGTGTYSKVFLTTQKDSVIKLMRYTDENAHVFVENEFEFDLLDDMANEKFWQFLIDMFTYIVWVSIFKHLFNEMRVNIDYTNYLCNIKRPFIIYDRNNRSTFRIGYIIQYYSNSMHEVLQNPIDSFSLPTTSVISTLYMLSTMLANLHKLGQYGLVLLHRDLSPNNIMIDDDDKIRLIDFGFAYTLLTFKNGEKIQLGAFFDPRFDKVNEPYYDIIFFVLYMVLYSHKVLICLEIYKRCKDLIMLKENQTLIDLYDVTSLWEYPYAAKYIDKDMLVTNFVKIFSQPYYPY